MHSGRHHGIALPAVDGHQEHLVFPNQEEQADLQHRKTEDLLAFVEFTHQ